MSMYTSHQFCNPHGSCSTIQTSPHSTNATGMTNGFCISIPYFFCHVNENLNTMKLKWWSSAWYYKKKEGELYLYMYGMVTDHITILHDKMSKWSRYLWLVIPLIRWHNLECKSYPLSLSLSLPRVLVMSLISKFINNAMYREKGRLHKDSIPIHQHVIV